MNAEFVASCVYTNSFANAAECREYRGAGWNEASAASDCAAVFLGAAGELTVGTACSFDSEVGRCVVGDLGGDGYLTVSSGDASACGAARAGCETFAGGTFTPDPSCSLCSPGGDEPPGAVIPTEPDCRAPLVGEAAGNGPGGSVCTNVIISGSTEPGRKFADYADCSVVLTQRPYSASTSPVANSDPDDPRLSDAAYLAEVDWLKAQAESSACSCCHSSSVTPAGAAEWDTEAGRLWIDTVSDEALAMFAGFTDSAAFGYLPVEQNNGFDRSSTGLPTTDAPRLRAFAERELNRRGVSMEQAATLAPFAPFFRDLIEYEPAACDDGSGIDADGSIRWTGGGARYLWVLEPDAASPGVPPNWDLPDGTLWALRVDSDAAPLGCGMKYGEAVAGAIQRVPADSQPAPLVSGQQYYLAVMRDIGQPITRCLFTAP